MSTSLSGLLLPAESWLLITGLLPLAGLAPLPDRRQEADSRHQEWQASDRRSHVDILVPTCGEPLAVLQRSSWAARSRAIPPRSGCWMMLVEEVRQLARQLAVAARIA